MGNYKKIKPIKFAFEKSPIIKISFLFFAHFDIFGQNKIIGVFWRGYNFPVETAINGWVNIKSGAIAQKIYLIDGKNYINAVFKFCKIIRYKLDNYNYN